MTVSTLYLQRGCALTVHHGNFILTSRPPVLNWGAATSPTPPTPTLKINLANPRLQQTFIIRAERINDEFDNSSFSLKAQPTRHQAER